MRGSHHPDKPAHPGWIGQPVVGRDVADGTLGRKKDCHQFNNGDDAGVALNRRLLHPLSQCIQEAHKKPQGQWCLSHGASSNPKRSLQNTRDLTAVPRRLEWRWLARPVAAPRQGGRFPPWGRMDVSSTTQAYAGADSCCLQKTTKGFALNHYDLAFQMHKESEILRHHGGLEVDLIYACPQDPLRPLGKKRKQRGRVSKKKHCKSRKQG